MMKPAMPSFVSSPLQWLALGPALRLSAVVGAAALALLSTAVTFAARPRPVPRQPNIIFILADDLGYGEVGCYGQTKIKTPSIDRMATEGMRFTQFYAGSTVCAPSRSVLMTGQHLGHTRVRGNAGAGNHDAQTLQASDTTIATILQKGGYSTGLIGKWGLGELGSPGEPSRQGFGYQFGFINQTHAHNHYPDHVWRNGQRVDLPNDLVKVGKAEGTGYSVERKVYIDDVFAQESLDFITRNQKQPFFLFLALVTPHANGERKTALGDGNEVPDQGIYASEPWTDSNRNHAAMVTRMDRDIGAILDHLKKLGLDENTLVIFSSDNGAHTEGGPRYDTKFFNVSGPLSGIKRSLTDGGIRVPFIARWPGKIAPDTVSNHVGYFGDLLVTWAEFAGIPVSDPRDGISIVPTLTGKGKQLDHDYLYWEFYERGVSQALLIGGRWKAIRLKTLDAPIRIYDLKNDISESRDVAAEHPEIVKRASELFVTAHVSNEYWKLKPMATAGF